MLLWFNASLSLCSYMLSLSLSTPLALSLSLSRSLVCSFSILHLISIYFCLITNIFIIFRFLFGHILSASSSLFSIAVNISENSVVCSYYHCDLSVLFASHHPTHLIIFCFSEIVLSSSIYPSIQISISIFYPFCVLLISVIQHIEQLNVTS